LLHQGGLPRLVWPTHKLDQSPRLGEALTQGICLRTLEGRFAHNSE
jgi:hypothetical protein